MKNTLSIKKEYWPEVTDTPHFIVKLNYEGCKIEVDDIYFDKLDEIIVRLETLNKERTGSVELQGGFRFNAVIEVKETGACQFIFATESSGEFPGKLHLEGIFSINGEDSGLFINSLIKLFRDGKEFII
ncbi:MAG: hypothetical protein AXA67_11990 [Methylothermaceae bacteria B42]|nr:MAG: hypothetical protein AXA67_11990 [Methylothermaceae bacteria B42]